MKLYLNRRRLAQTALVAAATLSASSAFATPPTTLLTDQVSGDLFLGFRETGNLTDLEVDIGSVAKFTPVALGGTWNGSAFNLTFGVLPTTTTVVNNIGADLIATFGNSWATNTQDQNGVRWGVAGNESSTTSPLTINPGKNTVFLTQAETTLGQQTTAPAAGAVVFATASSGIKGIEGNPGYAGNNQSTPNSSVDLIESSSGSNSWNTEIGGIGGGFGSGLAIEQALSGPLAGPVNSELDLYLISNTGTGGASKAGVYLGSFTLDSSGDVTFSNVNSVPEPAGVALLGLGAAVLGMVRRRKSSEAEAPAVAILG
jgi:hypothetical protein